MLEALFGLSLFPYLLFLWYATKNPHFPVLARWGFYGTLGFVAITIPCAVYAQQAYSKSLSNVDWLHGTAESTLTLANVLVVMGFKSALDRSAQAKAEDKSMDSFLQQKN